MGVARKITRRYIRAHALFFGMRQWSNGAFTLTETPIKKGICISVYLGAV